MESTPSQPRVLGFGLFELDVERRELRKSGVRQKLAGQPFQVLQFLLEHPQQIVTREELRQRLWPRDTFVDYDLALKKAVNRIREVLGDSAESPRFIETAPRRGYRFIAPVNENSKPALSPAPLTPKVLQARPIGWNFRIGIGLGLVTVALLGGILGLMTARLWRRPPDRSGAPSIRSLAVLPLESFSGDPSQEYFSDGMTDALITDLAQIGSLKVTSRTSVMRYKSSGKPLPQIARELSVDGIVEGTVQRSGDRVRLTVQLIDGRSDQHIWAASYERPLVDVFTLERNLTMEVADEIQARLTRETQARLATPQPVSTKVLEAYWQGEYHLHTFERGFGDDAKRKAAFRFQQAIVADPNFAPAYVGLVYAHYRLWPTDDDLDIMMASAEKAVALDPGLAEARVALGDAKWAAGAWTEAEQQFRMGIALSPNHAGSHTSLGNILDVTGRFDEGLKEQEIAQTLDPGYDRLSWAFYRRGQYDRSIEVLQRFLKSRPEISFTHWGLAQNYLQERVTKQWVTEVGAYMASVGFPEVAGHLQRAAAVGGYRGALRQWAKELERLCASRKFYWPGVLAQTYSILGDKERAFYWLEDAYQHRLQAYNDPYLWGGLRIDPGFNNLRSDPRYDDLLRRLRLPAVRHSSL